MTVIPTAQAQLFDVADALPLGLEYRAGFVGEAEQTELLALVATLPLQQASFRQYTARRRVHFIDAQALPPPLLTLRDRLAAWAGEAPSAFVHALISEYRPGTPLGWHRDAPQYELVCGLSLGSTAQLRFRPWPPQAGRSEGTLALELAPRSAYLMRGPARWAWQHGVPPVPSQRWSITMRTRR